MRLTLLIIGLVMAVGCGGKTQDPPVVTVTKLPDAFRRLELLGYSRVGGRSVVGQEWIYYTHIGPDATFGVEVAKWSGGDRIKDVTFFCYTDENGFKSDRSPFWAKMKRDFQSLFNASEDLSRAVSDLHEMTDGPVLRQEGRATTADGWKIQVVEDVGFYKPTYEKEEKHGMRVGLIMATHLETNENIPLSAVQAYIEQEASNKQMEK